MSKKKLNIEAITNELRGNSAFFPSTHSPTQTEKQDVSNSQEVLPSPPFPTEEVISQPKPAVVKSPKKEDNIVINITSNITILQSELEKLKEPSYKPQTFRLGDEEIDKLKDLAYDLSKVMKRKVTQGDLLRIALFLLEKNIVSNKDDLLKILKEI